MVALIVTPTIAAAVAEYRRLRWTDESSTSPKHTAEQEDVPHLDETESGLRLIPHRTLIQISKYLKRNAESHSLDSYRLDVLLRGTSVYIPPRPAPTESDEVKQLLKEVREKEQERKYRLMTRSSPADQFGSPGQKLQVGELKEHLSTIANVLFSVFGTAGAVWAVSAHRSPSTRVLLALLAGLVVAVADVVIYMRFTRKTSPASSAPDGPNGRTKKVSSPQKESPSRAGDNSNSSRSTDTARTTGAAIPIEAGGNGEGMKSRKSGKAGRP